jgi:hypothetical protein
MLVATDNQDGHYTGEQPPIDVLLEQQACRGCGKLGRRLLRGSEAQLSTCGRVCG